MYQNNFYTSFTKRKNKPTQYRPPLFAFEQGVRNFKRIANLIVLQERIFPLNVRFSNAPQLRILIPASFTFLKNFISFLFFITIIIRIYFSLHPGRSVESCAFVRFSNFFAKVVIEGAENTIHNTRMVVLSEYLAGPAKNFSLPLKIE